jgi:hypothetical protein
MNLQGDKVDLELVLQELHFRWWKGILAIHLSIQEVFIQSVLCQYLPCPPGKAVKGLTLIHSKYE